MPNTLPNKDAAMPASSLVRSLRKGRATLSSVVSIGRLTWDFHLVSLASVHASRNGSHGTPARTSWRSQDSQVAAAFLHHFWEAEVADWNTSQTRAMTSLSAPTAYGLHRASAAQHDPRRRNRRRHIERPPATPRTTRASNDAAGDVADDHADRPPRKRAPDAPKLNKREFAMWCKTMRCV